MAIRLLIVCMAHLAIFESVFWMTVHCRREQTDELISLAFNFLLFVGLLIWAVRPGFRQIENKFLRLASRAVVVMVIFWSMHTIDYFYSWHVRPNLGLYREPVWVAQYPGFQKNLREKIQNNLWGASSDESTESPERPIHAN